MAMESSGDLLISDRGNYRMREVSSGGTLSTIAGNGSASYSGDSGSASAAELNSPAGLVEDSSGDLFVVDSGNNVVREVNTSGIISTIAGDGSPGYSGDGGLGTSAELNVPTEVALGSGGLYIGDSANNVVRFVSLSSGDISTVAGTGTVGLSGDGGLATSARFNAPSGVVLDANGNLWISDSNNSRVRFVSGGGSL